MYVYIRTGVATVLGFRTYILYTYESTKGLTGVTWVQEGSTKIPLGMLLGDCYKICYATILNTLFMAQRIKNEI